MSGLPVDLHLSQAYSLLPAGHPELEPYLPKLPAAWQAALSASVYPDDAVALIWKPLAERARGWVTRLSVITTGFALVISPAEASPGEMQPGSAGPAPSFQPKLLYLSNWGGELHGWLAGPPAGEAALADCEARLGFQLPASYVRLAQIHDGLLENGDPASGFSLLADLRLHPQDPDLLPFFGDGSGDRQCFHYLAPIGRGDFSTLTYDHEMGSTRRPQSFWSFLKELTVRGFG